MSEEQSQNSTDPDGPPAPIRWRCWPLAENRVQGTLMSVALVAAAVWVYVLTGQIFSALLAMAALTAALWRYYLPVFFALTEKGVDQWCLGRRLRVPWQAVTRHEECRDGVLLLPDANGAPISAFRGLYVPFGPHRKEVLAHIDFYLERSDRSSRLVAAATASTKSRVAGD